MDYAVFTPDAARKIARIAARYGRDERGNKRSTNDPAFPVAEPERWFDFRNDYAGTVPAYAVMRPTGFALNRGDESFTASQPSASVPDFYLFNGAAAVPYGEYGRATMDAPRKVLFSGSVPTFGTTCGPVSGTWGMTTAGTGFTTLGPVDAAGTMAWVYEATAAAGAQSCGYSGLGGTQTITATSGNIKLNIGPAGGTTANGCTITAGNGKITISPAGYYTIDAKISADGSAIGGPFLLLAIWKNGVNLTGEYGKLSSGVLNATGSTSLHRIENLAAADYLELYVNSSSAAINWNIYYAELRVVQILGTP